MKYILYIHVYILTCIWNGGKSYYTLTKVKNKLIELTNKSGSQKLLKWVLQ